MVAIVDDEDYDWLSQWKWSAIWNGRNWYAFRQPWEKSNRKNVYMHRVILGAPDGTDVDHIDTGETLNNRRENLRLCTVSQNGMNRPFPKNNASGYKGVYWNKKDRKWQADICVNQARHHLGQFVDIEDAARAYDEAARKYHGEFAWTNFK